jgi:transcription-repair coupling factor (superfamily II helicase)
MVPEQKAMTADAVKRLKAIEALEELGIGFTLATHDLEIRGAGEILGEGQSGHIQEIGFSLYMQLLDRVVRAMKDNKELDLDQPLDYGAEIDLHIPALIPDTFLPDVHMRLIMYKRIASIKHESELIDLKEEMIDRFGGLPEALNNLLDITKLKHKASTLGIRKIDLGEKGGCIYFREHSNIDPKCIFELIESNPKDYKFDGPDKLRINKKLTKKVSRIVFLEYFFNEIVLKEAA